MKDYEQLAKSIASKLTGEEREFFLAECSGYPWPIDCSDYFQCDAETAFHQANIDNFKICGTEPCLFQKEYLSMKAKLEAEIQDASNRIVLSFADQITKGSDADAVNFAKSMKRAIKDERRQKEAQFKYSILSHRRDWDKKVSDSSNKANVSDDSA